MELKLWNYIIKIENVKLGKKKPYFVVTVTVMVMTKFSQSILKLVKL